MWTVCYRLICLLLVLCQCANIRVLEDLRVGQGSPLTSGVSGTVSSNDGLTGFSGGDGLSTRGGLGNFLWEDVG